MLLAIIILVGCMVATGPDVHHTDSMSVNRAMRMSDAMEKKAIAKAAETAAMQQEEKDKMASQDTMMPSDSTSSMAN